MSVKIDSTAKELTKIFNEAVHRAQEENRRLGFPNVYSRGGRIYREKLTDQSKRDK